MVTDPCEALSAGDVVLVIDVQNDFCPGGALPVENGDAVVPALNRWIAAAVARDVPVYVSRDWHPLEHPSFAENGGPWPPHCLQDTHGAGFHPGLSVPDSAIIVSKGVRFDQDQNSAFDQTGLAYHLRTRDVARLWVGGLAEDVCVLASVLDARREGFAVVLIDDATRPLTPEGGRAARAAMRDAGADVRD
jgi:nicotinamidase/pyrazinamidase